MAYCIIAKWENYNKSEKALVELRAPKEIGEDSIVAIKVGVGEYTYFASSIMEFIFDENRTGNKLYLDFGQRLSVDIDDVYNALVMGL